MVGCLLVVGDVTGFERIWFKFTSKSTANNSNWMREWMNGWMIARTSEWMKSNKFRFSFQTTFCSARFASENMSIYLKIDHIMNISRRFLANKRLHTFTKYFVIISGITWNFGQKQCSSIFCRGFQQTNQNKSKFNKNSKIISNK